MMSNTLYIGYDLGDGETQLSFLSPDSKDPESKLMPTTAIFGQPIATAYGKEKGKVVLGNDLLNESAANADAYFANFKVKPTEAIRVLPTEVQTSLYDCCKQGNTERIREIYRRHNSQDFTMPKCVREFTDALFSHEQIQDGIAAFMDRCDSIGVLVGHPTKWSRDDAVLYLAMLQDSMLGTGTFTYQGRKSPLYIMLERESRAAFLYGRRRYAPTEDKGWNRSRYILVVDVGSSTVDVSAMSGLDPDNTHDDGQPYLGARLIDRAIYAKCKTKLRDQGVLPNFEQLVRENPTLEDIFVLACRKGKEEYFSAHGKLRVTIPPPLENIIPNDIKISREEVEELLLTPVSTLDRNGKWSVGSGWQEEFECFLRKQKVVLDEDKKEIARIILTGGAARMGFIQDTCARVFSGVYVHKDVNPGIAISHGLALVGRSNELSAAFRQDAESILGEHLVKLVKSKVSKLGSRIAGPIASTILDDIALDELRRWRSGSHRTLNDAMEAIKTRCSEENLKDRLSHHSGYNNAIREWVKSDLIGTINVELGKLKDRHGLTQLSIEHVDITNVPVKREDLLHNIDGSAIPSGLLEPGDAVAGYLAFITGVVAYTIMPTILLVVVYVVLAIVGSISATLASIIATILAAIPGAGWAILATLGGVAVGVLVFSGWESMKETISTGAGHLLGRKILLGREHPVEVGTAMG